MKNKIEKTRLETEKEQAGSLRYRIFW